MATMTSRSCWITTPATPRPFVPRKSDFRCGKDGVDFLRTEFRGRFLNGVKHGFGSLQQVSEGAGGVPTSVVLAKEEGEYFGDQKIGRHIFEQSFGTDAGDNDNGGGSLHLHNYRSINRSAIKPQHHGPLAEQVHGPTPLPYLKQQEQKEKKQGRVRTRTTKAAPEAKVALDMKTATSSRVEQTTDQTSRIREQLHHHQKGPKETHDTTAKSHNFLISTDTTNHATTERLAQDDNKRNGQNDLSRISGSALASTKNAKLRRAAVR